MFELVSYKRTKRKKRLKKKNCFLRTKKKSFLRTKKKSFLRTGVGLQIVSSGKRIFTLDPKEIFPIFERTQKSFFFCRQPTKRKRRKTRKRNNEEGEI